MMMDLYVYTCLVIMYLIHYHFYKLAEQLELLISAFYVPITPGEGV